MIPKVRLYCEAEYSASLFLLLRIGKGFGEKGRLKRQFAMDTY